MSSAAPPSRLAGSLDRLAAFLAILGIVQIWAIGATAGTGLGLFAHLVLWIPLALWFGARALGGGGSFRFSGVEGALAGFVAISFISVLRASYKLPAVEQALGYFSLALGLLAAVHVLGKDLLLSLLAPTVASLSIYAILQWAYYFPHLPQEYDPARHGPLTTELDWRIHLNRAFATFTGPNQLGGFLVLLLPVLLGSLLDGRGERGRAAAARGLSFGLGLLALGLSRSLGAALSLGIGGAAFLGLGLTRRRGRRALLWGGGLVLGAVLLAVLSTPLLPFLGRHSPSVHARRVYWQAAASIARIAPLLGVGLDNYQEYFPQLKPEVPQESAKAHNDYLQMAAETGIAGLAAWAAFLGVTLTVALERLRPPPEGFSPAAPGSVPRGLPSLAAGAGFFLAWTLGGKLDLGLALALGAAWIGVHLLAGPPRPDLSGEWTRIGTAAGLLGGLIHMTVEFDLSDSGVALALFLVAALAILLGNRSREIQLSRGACAAATGILVLAVLPLLGFATPRALAADTELEEAETALRAQAAIQPQGGAEDPAERALKRAEEAAALNPLSERAWGLQAEARAWRWRRLRRQGGTDERTHLELETEAQLIVGALRKALRLRPRSVRDQHELAEFHRLFRDHDLELYRQNPRSDSMAQALAEEHQRQALLHQERAVELYPTLAPNQYLLGRVLDEGGQAQEALPHYQEALRLSELAGRERENLDRLKLGPLARARCLLRLGRRPEALEALREDRGRPGGIDREDENDGVLGPLLDILKAREPLPRKGNP